MDADSHLLEFLIYFEVWRFISWLDKSFFLLSCEMYLSDIQQGNRSVLCKRLKLCMHPDAAWFVLLWNGTGVLNDLTHRTVMLYKHVIYLKYAAVWKDSKSLLISQPHLRFYSLWLSIKLRLKQLYDKTRDVANWVFKSFDIKNKKNKQTTKHVVYDAFF